MKIAVDIDDVLADLMIALTDFHNEHYGVENSVEDHTTYDLEEIWECTRDDKIRRVIKFANGGGFRNLEPMKGSKEAIAQLAKKYELAIVTSRFDFLEEDTKQWVEQHFPMCFSEIHVTNHHGENGRLKSVVCDEIRADIIIEDGPEHATLCAESGIRVLLFDAPWNRSISGKNITRVRSWEDILRELS